MDTHTKNALLALGSTPDDIANTLFELGIKGTPGAPTFDQRNIVGRYLEHCQTSNPYNWAYDHDNGGGVITLVVSKFDKHFDYGRYPQLEMN